MTTQLIPVFPGLIADHSTLIVNARDLHDFLDVRRDFSTWIKNRITEYGFVIDIDYLAVQNLRSPNLGAQNHEPKGLRTTTSLSIQPRNWQWWSVTRKVARYVATS